MEVFDVRTYDIETDRVFVTQMTIENIIMYPTHLNMSDVGIILLNHLRKENGLKTLDPSLVSGSIQDLKNTEKL